MFQCEIISSTHMFFPIKHRLRQPGSPLRAQSKPKNRSKKHENNECNSLTMGAAGHINSLSCHWLLRSMQGVPLGTSLSLDVGIGSESTMQSSTAAGPPSTRGETWWVCSASDRVVRTTKKGHRLQFAMTPTPFRRILTSQAPRESPQVLQEEISPLLHKGVIEIVSPEETHSGFYSRYFLVPKKRRAWLCLIIDLCALKYT